MPQARHQQNSFVGGGLSPRLDARDDLERYFSALRSSLNGVSLPHGGFERRPGTRFVAATKDSASSAARLIPFIFSTTQAYVCEFGNDGSGYIRFYANEGQLISGTPVEATHPYSVAEIEDLQFAQSIDVMYVVHPDHPPYKLERTSATAFTFTQVTFTDSKGPLRPANLTAITIVSSAASGSVTLTASAALFTSDDVGRVLRIQSGATLDYGIITAFASSTSVTATATTGGFPTVATDDWALGALSDTKGCRAVAFHEGRLTFGGFTDVPDWFHMSVSDDFENFDIGNDALSAEELADRSVAKRTVGAQLNAIRWLVSAAERMVIGTSGAMFTVRGENDDFITPGGVVVKPGPVRRVAATQPAIINRQVGFLQGGRKRFLTFDFDINVDGFTARDISIADRTFLRSRGQHTVYQQEPWSVTWMPMADGTLGGMTIEAEQNVNGGHLHAFGGKFQGGDAICESAAVIPNPAETEDQLWGIVKRTINGATTRHVEFLEDAFDPEVDPVRDRVLPLVAAVEKAFFVDSGLTLDTPLGSGIAGITSASPPVVTTSGSHTVTDGQVIKIRDVVGLEDAAGDSIVNLRSYTAANVTATTIELSGADFSGVATAYGNGGTVRLETTAISGLGHLEGETVQVLADGATQPDKVVVSGAITLDTAASIVHVGLPYVYSGETNRFLGGSAVGSSQAALSRIQKAAVRVMNTVGIEVASGPNPAEAKFQKPEFRPGNHPMNLASPLFSGDVEVPIEDDYETVPTIFFRQVAPLPCTVLAVYPKVDTHDS